MKNKIDKMYRTLLGVVLLGIMLSCTSDLGEVNKDPYKSDYIPVENNFVTIMNNVIPVINNGNVFQRQQNLFGDIYSGYMMTSTVFSMDNTPQYVFPNEWLNTPFKISFSAMSAAIIKIKKSLTSSSGEVLPEYKDYYALMQILRVAGMHRYADMWGPIPYSQITGDELQVAYDDLETLYNTFIAELTEAADMLDAYVGTPSGLADYDLVYGGDYEKWIKFANSLKLRLAMRMSYASPAEAQQYAEEAVNSKYGVMTVDADGAFIKFKGDYINPLHIVCNNYDDIRMGAAIETFLNGYNDPRRPAYFKTSGYGKYRGIRIGIGYTSETPYLLFSKINVDEFTPYPWMVASEVAFLRAEGALRGWNMGADAETWYENGIKLSFEQNGVSGVDAYIADATSKPANYFSPLLAGNINALTDVRIAWDQSANLEMKLEKIITQKWIALFPNGQEAWSEFRRSGYPKLFPVVVNKSNGVIDTDIQVRRTQFPPSEQINNEANYKDAVQKLGGLDNGGTKLWWDKK